MSSPDTEPECCRKTRDEWDRRIRLYYSSFPVIKDVPCAGCRKILNLRVYEAPAVGE